MSSQELDELEHAACPGAGACGGQYTANTMSMVMEVLGLSPMGWNSVPAVDPDRPRVARATGHLIMDVLAAEPEASVPRHTGVTRERRGDRGRVRRFDERRPAPSRAGP